MSRVAYGRERPRAALNRKEEVTIVPIEDFASWASRKEAEDRADADEAHASWRIPKGTCPGSRGERTWAQPSPSGL